MKKAEKWKAIYEELTGNTIKSSVSDETERLALAAYMIGKDEESFELFEQSHHKYNKCGKMCLLVRTNISQFRTYLTGQWMDRKSGKAL